MFCIHACCIHLIICMQNKFKNSRQRTEPDPSAVTRCDCKLVADLKTVAKEGDNKGRQFYCCSKSVYILPATLVADDLAEFPKRLDANCMSSLLP